MYTPFEIDENLTDVQDFAGDGGGAPALPPGEYVFDVVHLVQNTARSSGQSKVEVTFECVEPAEHVGVRLNNNYSLQPQAIGRLKRLMLACGARVDKIRSDEIIGGRIRASVVHNTGQPQSNPDGTPKLGADGQPIPPRVFANIANERPMEAAQPQQQQQQVAPPPVTRGKAGNAQPTRRA